MVTHPLTPDAVLRAVADPTRRAILGMLREDELPVGDVAKRFRVSRPAVSKHLRVLRRAKLVVERREGRQRVYALNAEPLMLVDQWLRDYRPFWRASLARLKRHVESQPQDTYDTGGGPAHGRDRREHGDQRAGRARVSGAHDAE